ncbi:MAG: hypothetical protein LBD10_11335 [Desulfobulbus sp.]|jgi:chemotaxis protein CheY-P-specific phosphatase CheC/ActR/RegA family two-component response regulator|uniref:hypothetical protein n=1 Tax=Desulfobulbus sp. TaxID=895 RepID=UPI0028488CBC|nr:hypothetical protein [Desulfobulbus sp.]MDR2550781.1 hypothetical protein [Desulfobulbus sp.]
MKAKERFDKILSSCCDRIQEEVSALLGKPFKLGEPEFRHASKQDLFSEPGGKEVLIHASLEGELQGNGCVLTGIRDAIYIGGTLIMLPESELENILSEEDYSEELEDSYGEVANIICGAITVILEEQYLKSVRLVRREQEVVVPVEVEIESEQPILDVLYYQMSAPMQLDGRELGPLRLILPAVPFGLESSAGASAKPEPAGQAATVNREASATAEPVEVLERAAAEEGATEGDEAVEEQAPSAAAAPALEEQAERLQEVERQKELVDNLLQGGMAKMCEEVSALLGGSLKVVPEGNGVVSKGEFLEQAGGKQIMTRMEIRGDHQGEAYLFVEDRTAIYLGGTLIMLPEIELEETVRNEDFGDDAHDAYGEVTNIIAGVYTALFEAKYSGKFGLVKTSMEQVVPVKIDPDADEVFPAQPYYLSTGKIQYNDRDLGRLQLLIPASALALEDAHLLNEAIESAVAPRHEAPATVPAGKPAAPSRLREQPEESPDILLFTDDDGEAERIAEMLAAMGYVCRLLHFKDPVHSVLTPRVRIVFLIMREASELGFGVAIKISSAGLPVPLVAAGPAWTRTLVLKAVKYGACDILITPASSDDIREKIEVNLVKKAA